MKKNNINCSPIIIFTYRRKIDKMIESLLKNRLAIESELYIFSDGYKNEVDKEDVLEVRKYLKEIDGFKNVTVIESSANKGLANSIIGGVTKIVNEYGKVIVLEDDVIVADNFLEYMNEALVFYEKDEKIWSVSGYTPDLECLKNYEKDIYLSVRASSWGWATWKDRWDRVDWNIEDWKIFKEDKEAQKRFNQGGDDMYVMLKMQMLNKIDSWAIRWCYNQFKYEAYTVYPTVSKLKNIGFDGKGIHNLSGFKRWSVDVSNTQVKFENLVENKLIIKYFKERYNRRLKTKIGYFLKEYGGYDFVKKILKRW